MNDQTQAAEQLIIDKLTGNISEVDDMLLAEMIASDDNLKKVYQDTLLAYTSWKRKDKFSGKDEAWKILTAQLSSVGISSSGDASLGERSPHLNPPPLGEDLKKLTRVRGMRPWMAAASIVIICVIGFLIYFFVRGGDPAAATKQMIQLKLANGKVVDIDKGKRGTIQLDKLTVNYDSAGMKYSLNSEADHGVLQMGTISVPQGLDYYMVLDDGTEVWLNAATDLKFPLQFTGNSREVSLKGEAFFKVAKNANKPFIVATDGMSVKVTGTSFNIKAYPGEGIQTSLVEGKVVTKNKKGELALTPGKAAYLRMDGELAAGSFDEEMALAWMRGYYFFKDEPITAINPTLHRWFGYNFRYQDASIADIRFSGALEKGQSLETFLRRVASAANLSYRIGEKEVVLSRK